MCSRIPDRRLSEWRSMLASRRSRAVMCSFRLHRVLPMERRKKLVLLGAATVVLNLVLAWIDERLKRTGGPGIIGLEFAGSLDRVHEIEAEWGGHGEYLARLSL